MKKISVIGSNLCPDCLAVKEYLSQNNISYDFIEITESLQNLKTFLSYRDNRAEFDNIKKEGKIGIPLITVEGSDKLIFDVKPDLSQLK
jgi:glutaredoxin-related protein